MRINRVITHDLPRISTLLERCFGIKTSPCSKTRADDLGGTGV